MLDGIRLCGTVGVATVAMVELCMVAVVGLCAVCWQGNRCCLLFLLVVICVGLVLCFGVLLHTIV